MELVRSVDEPDPLDKFEKRCPPGGEQRVVLYFTSLRGIRNTYESCNNVKRILRSLQFRVDERDVSMHMAFRRELRDLMKSSKPVAALPRLFIKGHYIGGAEEVSLLHDDGMLRKLLEDLPTQTSWEECNGCGGVRFMPCSRCSGSRKWIDEKRNRIHRCPRCNENGLMRCPLCY